MRWVIRWRTNVCKRMRIEQQMSTNDKQKRKQDRTEVFEIQFGFYFCLILYAIF